MFLIVILFGWLCGSVECLRLSRSSGRETVPLVHYGAWASIGDRHFRFGGRNSSGLVGDLVEVNAKRGSYTMLPAAGERPSPRWQATLTPIGSRYLFLFGGEDRLGLRNDFFVYDLEEQIWNRGFSMSQPAPSPRRLHAASGTGAGSVFVSGGVNATGGSANDVWLFDLAVPRMALNSQLVTFGVFRLIHLPMFPSRALHGHRTELIESRLFFIDQFDVRPKSQDCVAEWVDLAVAPHRLSSQRLPSCPPILKDAATVRFGHVIFRFGGCNMDTLKCEPHTYALDTANLTHGWRKVSTNPSLPIRMDFHASRISSTQIAITAGTLGPYNDPITDTDVTATYIAEVTHSDTVGVTVGDTSGDTSNCPLGGCLKGGECSGGSCVCQSEDVGGLDCGDNVNLSSVKPPCFGHGILRLSGICDCYLGFTGTQCQFGSNMCPDNCNGRGVCNEKSQCECQPPYAGLRCERKTNCPRNCCNRGICNYADECDCNLPFVGKSCLVSMTDAAALKLTAQEFIDGIHILKNQLIQQLAQNQNYTTEGTTNGIDGTNGTTNATTTTTTTLHNFSNVTFSESRLRSLTEFVPDEVWQELNATYRRAESALRSTNENVELFFDTNATCQPYLVPFTYPSYSELNATTNTTMKVKLDGLQKTGRTISEQLGYSLDDWWKEYQRGLTEGSETKKALEEKEEEERKEAEEELELELEGALSGGGLNALSFQARFSLSVLCTGLIIASMLYTVRHAQLWRAELHQSENAIPLMTGTAD